MRRILSALLALAPAVTNTPAAAPAALQRAKQFYSDGSAHASVFAQTYTPAGFSSARRETGTVWIQAPQRLRFDYDAPEKKTFTYDSGEGRFYSPEDAQLTIKTLTADERSRLPIVFLSDPAELDRQFAISAESGGRVLLSPRAPMPELAWLRLTIGADGTVSGLAYEDQGGNRTEFRFDAWRTEKPRPAADYRVTGPKGTRVVE